MAMDQLKLANELRKAQKELANEIIEVEAGDGAVIIQISGELKIKDVKINSEMIDLENISELEGWIQVAVRDGYEKAQEIATEKMQPLMGSVGSLMG